MFWLPLIGFIVLASPLIVDWRRTPEFIPAMLATVTVSGLHLALPYVDTLYRYTDHGVLSDHWAIAVLLQLIVAPIFAAWFIQDIPPNGTLPWRRMLRFLAMGACLEWAAWGAGRLSFSAWWGPLLAPFLYAGHCLVVWYCHLYCRVIVPLQLQPSHSSPPEVTPGVLPAPRPSHLDIGPLDR